VTRVPELQNLYNDEKVSATYIKTLRKGPVALMGWYFVREILKGYGQKSDLTLLDVGTGPGWIPTRLAQARPNWKITAVDYSAPMLEYAKRQAQSKNITIKWVQSTFETLEMEPHKFDLITNHLSFHEFKDPSSVLKKMIHLTKEGGHIEIQDLIRPNILTRPLLNFWGLFYPKSIQNQYQSSLKSSYSLQEVKDLVKPHPIKAKIHSMLGSFFRLSLSNR